MESLGNAFEFDGVDDSIKINNAPNINFTIGDAYSISFWINSKENRDDRSITEKWNPTVGGYAWAIRTESNGGIRFAIYNGSLSKSTGTSSTVNNTGWHHYVAINNGTHLSSYLDGTIIGNPSIIGDYTGDLGFNDITLGWRVSGSTAFNGSIDEFKIYNRTITPAEISEYYNRSVNKYYDKKLSEDWQFIDNKKAYLQNTDVWMWSDYNCSFSTWNLFNPYFYFRQCCEGCICSEDL